MDLSSNKSLHLTMPPNRFHDPTRPIQPDTSPLHNVKQPRSSSNETQRQPSHEDHQTFFKPGCILGDGTSSQAAKGRTAAAHFCASQAKNGGAGRDRTDDLKLAKLPLSQLSYGPFLRRSGAARLAQTCAARGRACGDFVADTPS